MLKLLKRAITLMLAYAGAKQSLADDASSAGPRRRLRRTTRRTDRERRDAYEMVAEGRRWRVWSFEGGERDPLDPAGDERAELRSSGLYFESPVELRFLPMDAAELPSYKRLNLMKGSDLRALLHAARPVTRSAP